MAELTIGARKRRARAGFTLIEVMVSLGVIMVAASAMAALMSRGVQATTQARKLAIAMEIAERWSSRFKQDAQTWTAVGYPAGTPNQPTAATVLQNTLWLSAVNASPNVFQAITIPNQSLVSNAFDFYGNDVLPGAVNAPPIEYCAAYRPNWVYFGRTMRIDIRVWWRKETQTKTAAATTIAADFTSCTAQIANLEPGGTQVSNYHVVYLPVIISAMTN